MGREGRERRREPTVRGGRRGGVGAATGVADGKLAKGGYGTHHSFL
jgi:hypothetical protein